MITIKNWGKLIKLFRSKLQIVESDMLYVINYYYPSLSSGDYYRITLSRFNPSNKNHEHKNEYLLLCGDCKYWLSRKELKDVDSVYEAIIDVATRHHIEVGQ